jgi:hypothetical protein
MKEEEKYAELPAAKIRSCGYGRERWWGGARFRLLAGDTMTGSAPTLCQLLPIGRIGACRGNRKREDHRAYSRSHLGGHFGFADFCALPLW